MNAVEIPRKSARSLGMGVVCLIGVLAAAWPRGSIGPQAYLAAVVGVGLLFILSLHAIPGRRPVAGWVAGLGMALLVLHAYAAVHVHQALLEALRWGSYGLLGAIFYQIREDRHARVLFGLVVLGGAFYAAYGLLQLHGYLDSSWWSNPDMLASRLINSAHFAGFLLIPIMLSVGMLFSPVGAWRLLPLMSLPLMAAALVRTQSRSGWICLVFSAGLFAMLWWFAGKGRSSSVSRAWGVAVLAMLLGGVAFGIWHMGADRISVLWLTNFQTVSQRVEVWLTCLWLVLTYPLGVGVGNLARVSPGFRLVSDRFLLDYAHNEPLQVAAELGVAGLLIALILFLACQQRLLRSRHADGMQIGLTAGLGGVLLMSLVDFPLRVPANAMLFAAVVGLQMGMISGSPQGVPGAANSPRKLPGSLGSLGMAACAAVLMVSDMRLQEGKGFLEVFAWDKAKKAIGQAGRLAPWNPEPDMRLGQLWRRRSLVAVDKKELSGKALVAFEQAVAKSPEHAALLALADAREAQGDLEGAHQAFRRAVAAFPKRGIGHLRLGYFLLRHGHWDTAARSFRRTASLHTPGKNAGLHDILREFYSQSADYETLKKAVPDTPDAMQKFAAFLRAQGDSRGFEKADKAARGLAARDMQWTGGYGRPGQGAY